MLSNLKFACLISMVDLCRKDYTGGQAYFEVTDKFTSAAHNY